MANGYIYPRQLVIKTFAGRPEILPVYLVEENYDGVGGIYLTKKLQWIQTKAKEFHGATVGNV